LRDLEFLRSAGRQDRELVQREFVLAIAARDGGRPRESRPERAHACRGNLRSTGTAEAARELLTFLVRPSFRWKFAEGELEFRPE